MKIDCLNHGHVRLIDHMGNDKRVVDAARVSYQQGTKKLSGDRGLIRYMLSHDHGSPFEKVVFEFHVKCPIFVARQWFRHRISSFNEISGRYSEMPDEIFIPETLRTQSKTNKQGSSDEALDIAYKDLIKLNAEEAYQKYDTLLKANAAREQARSVLPLGLYTEFYWTVNLRSLINFLKLRRDNHTQEETRTFANAIWDLISEHCDLEYSLEAIDDYIFRAPNITIFEIEALKAALLAHTNQDIIVLAIEERLKNNPKLSKREIKESKLLKLLKDV